MQHRDNVVAQIIQRLADRGAVLHRLMTRFEHDCRPKPVKCFESPGEYPALVPLNVDLNKVQSLDGVLDNDRIKPAERNGDPAARRGYPRQPGVASVDFELAHTVARGKGHGKHPRLAQIVDTQGRAQCVGNVRIGLATLHTPVGADRLGERHRPFAEIGSNVDDDATFRHEGERRSRHCEAIEEKALTLRVQRRRDKGKIARVGEHVGTRPITGKLSE